MTVSSTNGNGQVHGAAGRRIHLHMIYDVEGWAFSHNARDLARYAPPEFHITMGPLTDAEGRPDYDEALGETPMDILYVMHTGHQKPRMLYRAAEARGWNPARLGAWSAGWPLYQEMFEERHDEADVLLINNRIAWEAFGRAPKSVCCPLGVDFGTFHVTRPIEEREHKVVWTGSEFWRKVKGYDDFVLPLEERLRALRIPTDFRIVDSHGSQRRAHAEMAAWYNDATVLICASETEGTPNPALEAAACGCVVVSTPVGNMPELIRSGENGFLVERTVDGLLEGVLSAIARYLELAPRLQLDIREWGWDRRAIVFYEACREALRVRDQRLAQITAADPAQSR